MLRKNHIVVKQLLIFIIVIGISFIIMQCSNENQISKEPSGLGSIIIQIVDKIYFYNHSIGVGIYMYEDSTDGYHAIEDRNIKPIYDSYSTKTIRIDSLSVGLYDVMISLYYDNSKLPYDTNFYKKRGFNVVDDNGDSTFLLPELPPPSVYYEPAIVYEVRVASDSISFIEVSRLLLGVSFRDISFDPTYHLWPVYWKEKFIVK